MTTVAARASGAWRLWALVPLVVLVAIVSLFATTGGSLIDLLGRTPPPADVFDVRRVEFKPGEIKVRVTNPQQDELTIATVTVDDAIVPFSVDGPRTLDRLRSATIVIPFAWVEDEPMLIGITSSSGIQTTHEVPAVVETPTPSPKGFLGFGLVGLLVGVVPVGLGLLWLPSLRRARPEWLAAFMALTAGLLAFLALEALSEAFALQAALPSALGGAGVVLLGFVGSYLTLTYISHKLVALATLVAIGIGLHNFGEGLAIGTSFAFGELALGTFLIIGFMIHNVTEGLGIATAATDERRVSFARLALLVLIAGAPAILGTWLGGYVRSDVLGVLFFAAAAGAAFEVVVEVGRWLRTRAPGGLTSGWVLGGFLSGVAIMYATGVLAG
jgi:zinc transporter, ZIP family